MGTEGTSSHHTDEDEVRCGALAERGYCLDVSIVAWADRARQGAVGGRRGGTRRRMRGKSCGRYGARWQGSARRRGACGHEDGCHHRKSGHGSPVGTEVELRNTEAGVTSEGRGPPPADGRKIPGRRRDIFRKIAVRNEDILKLPVVPFVPVPYPEPDRSAFPAMLDEHFGFTDAKKDE